jgi:hypothetical protein
MRSNGNGFSGVERPGVVNLSLPTGEPLPVISCGVPPDLAKIPDIGGVNRIAWGSA